ncbi:MAG: flagellar motor switch protein FliN, partial [Acidimicrobiaceae bacterium]|nr:flagellar motor switch protein FliN [Acidimicrobiaceae bacterium]
MAVVNEPSALDVIGAAIAGAAAAVAAQLPGGTVAGAVQETVAGLDAGPGARAVTATIDGAASGTVVIALAEPLASALENGPIGPQDLAAALEPALAEALAALEPTFGSPLELHAALAMEAEPALSSLRGAVVGVPLLVDGAVAAVFAVAVDIDDDPAVTTAGGMDLPDLDKPPARRRAPFGDPAALDLLADVEMGVTAELGRTRMTVRDLLALVPGSVVELDRVAGSAV